MDTLVTSTEYKNEVKMRCSPRTIHSLCDNEKIFVTMAGAASNAIASSSEEANEISEKTITLSILCILAN